MSQEGKFMLFDVTEFIQWLTALKVTRVIKLIQNHHTWQPDYKAFEKIGNHFYWMKSMEDFQVNHEGFAQTAQNMTTFPDGKIGIGRPFDVAPAGILGANKYGLCIEHLGNFDSDEMTDQQKDTVIKINAALCKRFSIKVDEFGIVYHHFYDIITGKRTNGTGTVKTCPGVKFFGGNTVEALKANFLPLIQATLDAQNIVNV